MTKTEILNIEKLIREADFVGTNEAYSFVYEKLKEYEHKYPSNYLLDYFKGLVCYSNPDIEEFRTKWALDHFNSALKLNPEHLLSTIFIGHCLFDLKHYQKASVIFKSILSNKKNWIYLLDNDLSWRLVNIAEMVAVCNLKTGYITKFKTFYLPWKELFYLHSREDNFYFPVSMIIEVSKFLKSKGENMSDENIASFRKISLDLIGIIKGGDGFEEIYSEELENLKNWDGHQQFIHSKVYS